MADRTIRARKLVYSGVALALCMILPFLTGQIPQIGKMLSPMHIPVFLCGFVCGWPWGMAVGFIAPLLRGAVFGMPVLVPGGVAMAFELAVYGGLGGYLYHRLPKTIPWLYANLIISMVCGRIMWGIIRFLLAGITGTEFTFSLFIAGALTNAIPGIVLHLILIPAVTIAMQNAGLIEN